MKAAINEHIKVLLRKWGHCPYHLSARPDEHDCRRAVDAVNRALRDVPYYREYKVEVKSVADLERLPIITKRDVLDAQAQAFISRRVCRWATITKETGGTSGISLTVVRRPVDQLHYLQVANYAFSLIGKNLKVATLRGEKPGNGAIAQKVGPTWRLSSYQLNDANLDHYLHALEQNKISCLHVYPSSVVILARLIKRRYGHVDLPALKGVFASSEIFSREDKRLVKEAFGGVKIVDFYGLNELCCAAIAVDFEPYRFFYDYGFVEFVDDGQKLPSGNRLASIVATSVMNKTMPLVRYDTLDHVELNEQGEAIAIIGRTSDFLVNKQLQLTPCIFVNRDISFRHVVNFQYYQDTPGKLVFRVVSDGGFGPEDEANVLIDLRQSFLNMDTSVELVEQIEKTKVGKQKRLIQLLDIDKYK